MGSPFLYRLRVVSSKGGKNRDQHVIPIYAFKPGDMQSSAFSVGGIDLPLMKMIAEGADGARTLTVCTNSIYAYRALEEKDVEFFDLHIKDTRISTLPTEERKTVATITCHDMHGGKKTPIPNHQIKMSCEPLSNELQVVTLSFWDFQGGPVYQKL
jgi:hypothetical protein